MKQSTLFKMASQSILKNKVRAMLTMLGIVIGVGAVIVMVAIGNGAQMQIASQIKSLGTNLIIVMPGSGSPGGVNGGAGSFNRLTIADADQLKRDATQLAAVSPVVSARLQVLGGQSNWRTSINGVSTDFLTIREWSIASGSMFSQSDIAGSKKVAVLGATVVSNLFPNSDPVGAQIQIGKVPFQVIGVLAAKGQNAGGQDQDDVILVPYSTAQNRLSGNVRIGQILASATDAQSMDGAQAEIGDIMRVAHKLNGAPDDFTVRNQAEIVAAASSTTKVMSALLAAIASISLLVGGIGIMNIMLVSVTERTREIGLRMAIGARGRDVLTQFLVESLVMSVCGGVIGLGAGYGGAALLSKLTGWATATPISAVAVAVLFSAAVGIFFGFYPASKAAGLNPIQALRYE